MSVSPKYTTVCILGYGKIGKIKSPIYRSLGVSVCIVDPRVTEEECRKSGVRVYPSIVDAALHNPALIADDGLFDISTPTSLHLIGIEEVLDVYPKAKILVEKPLVNTCQDLIKIKNLLNAAVKPQIYINESYLSSTLLDKIKYLIKRHKLKIKSISVEFSKDRRNDVINGRFVDQELLSLGIEIPHVLAILNAIDNAPIIIEDVEFCDMKHEHIILKNQGGVVIKGHNTNGTAIELYQSLIGNLHLLTGHFSIPDSSYYSKRYRVIKAVFEDGYALYGQFEPIPLEEYRYISRYHFVKNDITIEKGSLEDNHLMRSLRELVSGKDLPDRDLSFGITITKEILNLLSKKIS